MKTYKDGVSFTQFLFLPLNQVETIDFTQYQEGGGGTCNLVDNGCAPRPPSASEFMLWHVDELFISGKKNTVLLIFLFLSLFACLDIKYSSTHTLSHGNKAINNGLACLVMFLSITGLFPARRKSLEQEKQSSALRLF